MFDPKRLRDARVGARLSMESVMRRLNRKGRSFTKASLSNWEQGRRVPKADILAPLAEIYKVDVSFFSPRK